MNALGRAESKRGCLQQRGRTQEAELGRQDSEYKSKGGYIREP